MGCGSSAHEGRNSEQLPTTPPSSKRDSPFETFQPSREYKEGDPLPRVWFQISINRIVRPEPLVFELFADVAPKTAENFRCLCTGERGRGPRSKVPLHFKGTKFHRIIPRFMAQGGDIEDRGGVGGESIFGRRFPDETFEGRAGRHVGLGTLSMANRGPDTNASQFFICFADTPHLDGKHVVFGQVVSGFETLKAIEAMGTKHGAPKGDVTIVDCGEGAEAGRGYRTASLISVQLHSDSGSGGSTGIITHTNTGSGAGSSTSLRPRDAGNSGGLRSVVGENDAGQLHSGSETESTTKINTTFAEASTSADELDREADREKRFASNSEPPAHLIGNYE